MKIPGWLLIIFLLICPKVNCQQISWSVGSYIFFDNTEFGRSKVTIPQTMAGVDLAPEIGLTWDTIHGINAGINLLHEFGSPVAIDKFFPTAYYELHGRHFEFMMGAFPRLAVLDKYPRAFFRDSVYYYKPDINGIFWEYRQDNHYANVWLDWTGRQSKTVNETFFIGFSGRYQPGIFYVQHFGYMYHFAGKLDPLIEEALHDNLLFYTSAGLDLSGIPILTKLEINAGWITGIERSRADNTGWLHSNGLLVEAHAQYKWLGLRNTFYKGDGLMRFYKEQGHDLYWGDPVYRARSYDRADFYITFLQKQEVSINLTYSLHFLEDRIYHEQMLKVIIDLNSRKL